jgi:hypothetical protein
MNLFDMISQSQDGNAIGNLASQFGLDPSQAEAALRQLAPAVGAGLHRNTSKGSGLSDLLGTLAQGKHERYADDPSLISAPEAVDDGNNILGHLFGSKEVSRKVAEHASASSGVSAAILKKMLPVVATMAMGGLAKKALGGSSGSMTNAVLNKVSRRSGGMLGGLLGKGIGSGIIGWLISRFVFGNAKKQRAGIFGSLLDRDGDGSYADDLISMAAKGLLK